MLDSPLRPACKVQIICLSNSYDIEQPDWKSNAWKYNKEIIYDFQCIHISCVVTAVDLKSTTNKGFT